MNSGKHLYSIVTLSKCILGFCFLLFALLLFSIFYTSMPSMLLKAEQSYMNKQLGIVSGTLEVSRINTYIMAHDLGDWDDTVEFVSGTYPEFFEENWSDISPLELYRFNLVIFTDKEGNPAYIEFYDFVSHTSLPVPEGFAEYVKPLAQRVVAKGGLPLVDGADISKRGAGGFLEYKGVPYYVACMPIKTEEGEDGLDVPGTVILGYIMGNEEMRELTHIDSADFEFVFSHDADGNSAISRESEEVVASVIPYRDIDGKPVYLRISEKRAIYQDGREAMTRTALLLAGCMALFGLIVLFAASRLVVRPIVRLSNDIRSGRFSSDTPPDTYAANREFMLLCRSISDMMSRLEESSLSLKTLQRILDGVDAQIFVSDPQTDEMYFANAAMRTAHNLPDSVQGLYCYRATEPGWEQRCPECRKGQLVDGVTIEWEQFHSDTGRFYRKTDTLIDWPGGAKAHLQCSVEMTELKRAESVLQKRLKQQELMSAMSRSFIEPEDMNILIDRAMRLAGDFMDLPRILLGRFDTDTGSLVVERDWVLPGMDLVSQRGLDLGPPDESFYEILMTDEASFAVFEDASAFAFTANNPQLSVQSLLIVPVHVSGDFWGIVGFDETRRPRRFEESEIQFGVHVASLVSGIIARTRADMAMMEAKEVAERSSMAKGEFLSRMSHEMRTPLNAIIGMTSIAKSSNELEKKVYCLEKIEDASRHLLGVINDILDMSKIEAKKFELVWEEFAFEKMLIRAVNVVNYRIDEKEQDFVVRIDRSVPYALISDEQRLTQVITNLLANATKFTPERGSIRLEARTVEALDDEVTIQVEVTDTGIGLNEEQQMRLFTSFEQADGGITRKYGGTGLGLAICRSIVELLGGRIWVQSRPGEGATFSFTFKAKKGKEEQRDVLGSGLDWKSLRILVVDDAPEVREYFSNLAQSIGLACEVAGSGEEAVDILARDAGTAFNIVFVDWKMPDMNGIELTRHIRENYGSQMVVIMISAAEWELIEKEAKAAGVDKFVAKPLFASLIVDCISEALGSLQMSAHAEHDDSEAGRFAGRRILLAEDIEINREIVLSLLQDTKLIIDCAANGEEAVRMFEADPTRYEMIFMDIHMPGVDGYQATRRIRALNVPRAATVPIVAMTANVFKEDIESCLAAGMNDHIGKPIDVTEIHRKLRLYLEKTPLSS